MFARSPRSIADLSSLSSFRSHTARQYHHTMTQFIEHAKTAARQQNLRHQQVTKQRYDRNRSNPQYFVGQSVLIRNRNSHINKFSPKFLGSYTIINRLHDKTYLVKINNTGHHAQVPVHDIRSLN